MLLLANDLVKITFTNKGRGETKMADGEVNASMFPINEIPEAIPFIFDF